MFAMTDIWRSKVLVAVAASMMAGSMVLAASNGSSAQYLVEQVMSSILDELTSRHEVLQDNPQSVNELVDQLVLPYFDFERMSRRALGKNWRLATPEQRTRFVSAFRAHLVRTYAVVLDQYRGQELTYLDPVPRKKDNEIVIPVQVELTSSQAITVAYAMHEKNGTGWKVFDVAIDGVSLVTNYRSSFRSEVARHGINGLIARLEEKSSDTD